jgi:hypothetical protein
MDPLAQLDDRQIYQQQTECFIRPIKTTQHDIYYNKKALQHGRNEVTMGNFESKYKQKDEGQYILRPVIILHLYL